MTAPTADFSIPPSESTVTVRVIDSTATIHYPAHHFFTPTIGSHDDLNCPAYSFLISHPTNPRSHVLFDLGVRKDYKTAFPKHFLDGLEKKGAWLQVDKDVADILDEAAANNDTLPSSRDIDAIIWSHHHFDHTGNPQRFPPTTSLIVGPGFKQGILPGYPQDPKASITSDMWSDRTLDELDFDASPLRIGPFAAYDYFSDGSFYVLATPGHAPGHVSALARVTPTTFVFMAGDAAHHGGELRPSTHRPLPSNVVAMPSSKRYCTSGCPCSVLEALLPHHDRPFYQPADAFCSDKQAALQSIDGICQLDGRDDTFILLAHDATVRGKIPHFPHTITAWRDSDLANKLRWNFVDDFAGTVDERAEAEAAT